MSEVGGGTILHVEEVTRSFGAVSAVDRLTLSIETGEFITLLGPSGCGKTTALRLIAGFERPNRGVIRFAGQDVTERTPQQRGFGMVFQSYALFPHLNVFENIAFGLRARRLGMDEIRKRVSAALEIVDLAPYADRAVQALSGGQQQRVALARALAIEPPLLLLDEPLSNLDQALRVQTRNDLRRLVKELGITAVFVTHDQEEAFDLSDRIAVMQAGRIHQIGSPRHLYENPADRFVAGFVGRANVFRGRIAPGGVRMSGEVVWRIGGDRPSIRAEPGQSCSVLVRPEDLRFGEGEEISETAIDGVVRDRRFRGGSVLYRVETSSLEGEPGGEGDDSVIEIIGSAEGPAVGSRVRIAPSETARLHVFLEEGGS